MEATAFGVMAIDEKRRIIDFVEKPADPPAMPGKPDRALASMGIYIFNARYLYRELERDMADPDSSHDFGKDIIPRMVKAGVAAAHPFDLSCVGAQGRGILPYWRDVGTIDAYWDANIDLTATDPMLNLYDTQLADLDLPAAAAAGQVRAQRRRPARHGHRVAGLGRLHRVGRRVPLGAVLAGAGALVLGRSTGRCCCRASRWPRRAAHARGGRPRLPHPGRHGDRRRPGGRRRALHRTESGITLVTRDMLRKRWHLDGGRG
jgi:hypothetical protein